MGNEKSLAHTRWNCKYHIVFAPKYRRQVFYREKRRAIGCILRKLCEWKSVRILEAECCADHIHMLVEIPPKMSVLKWHTEFGHLNRGDMLTSEQHRCSNEKKKFQRRV
ncbi:transposase [Escherichia coli]|nr:transposase [Escherichia coli]